MEEISAEEKLEAIESSDYLIAFDGCHKIYLAEIGEVSEASKSGYVLYPANKIRELINRSCGLVFVHPWNLEPHPWNIEQGRMPESWYDEQPV